MIMNSTKDITAASDTTNLFSSSGLSLDKLMAASVNSFNSNLYEHATAKAFIKTLINHANRSAGLRLNDTFTRFGRQYILPRDIEDTLPLSLLPPGASNIANRALPDWFNTPTCKVAVSQVSGALPLRIESGDAGGDEAPSLSPELNFSEEKINKIRPTITQRPEPPSAEELQDHRARTDEAFLLYGDDLPLIDGNSQLRALLQARRGETEIAIASRISTIDASVLRIVGALLKQPWVEPTDEVILEEAFHKWRLGLIPIALYFLMTASHYMRDLPAVPRGAVAPPPKIQMSLRDAQAKIWRLNFVRSLQRQLALLHDRFPVLLSRLRSAPGSRVPLTFAAVDDLPVDMLTSMLDFLQLQEYALSLFIRAASCPAAPASLVRSQRAQQALKSLDAPLCSLLASGHLVYVGSPIESLFGLFPLGALAAAVALDDYVSSPSLVLENFYELLRNLDFLDRHRVFNISAARMAISNGLLLVDGPPLILDVRLSLKLLHDAISRAGRTHPDIPEWRQFFKKEMTLQQSNVALETILRSSFDETLSGLEALEKEESFLVSLETTTDGAGGGGGRSSVSSLGPAHPVAIAVTQADLACDEDGLVMLVARVKAPPPECPNCHATPQYGADYCVPCGDFLPGTKCCGGCGAPTSAPFVARDICRGFTHWVPCNLNGGSAPPFRTPNATDKSNALLRHRRIQQLRTRMPGPGLSLPPTPAPPTWSSPPWQPPQPAAASAGSPAWGFQAAPQPPAWQTHGRPNRTVSSAEWAPSQPLLLEVFVLLGQAIPIVSAAGLKQAAAAAGLDLTASLGPTVSALHFSKDASPHAEVHMSTRDALYTFTAECSSDAATLGPGGTRFLYDTGAAMCVCGPGQLPLTVTSRIPRAMMGAGSSKLVSEYSGILALHFGPPSPAPPVNAFSWPRGFRPSRYRPLNRFVGSLFWAPAFVNDVYAIALRDGLEHDEDDSGGQPSSHRLSHNRLLRGAQDLHERFGITDPEIFKSIHLTATGVERVGAIDRERFLSLPYVISANRRTPVHSSRVELGEYVAGAAASLDLTRTFVSDVDGYVLSAIFMDLRTGLLWESPMRNHTCAEFIRVLAKYVAHVRDLFRVDLQLVHSDCDPVYTVTQRGPPRNASALQIYVNSLRSPLAFTHSPPHTQALNPVECAVRQLYHLLNFYLAQGSLTMLAWHDMLMAGVYARNRLPRPQSRRMELRSRSPLELATLKRPDMSDMIAAPGSLVAILRDGAKSSSCTAVADLAYYVCPEGAGHLARRLRDQALVFSRNVRPLPESCSVGRALSYAHTQHNGLLRDGLGIAGADAASVSAAARSLFDSARASGSVISEEYALVLLNPLTGLPERLAHALYDGSLGISLADDLLGLNTPAVPACEAALAAGPPSPPAGAVVVDPPMPPRLVREPMPPMPSDVPALCSRSSAKPPSALAWLRSLDVTTPLRFISGGKTGAGNKSATRYAAYSAARTIGEYIDINLQKEFTWADLQNDLMKGLASLPPGLWERRFRNGDMAQVLTIVAADSAELETLQDFASRAAASAAFLADSTDHLHERASRLAPHDPHLAIAARLEALEDGSPSPPHFGQLSQALAEDGHMSYRQYLEHDKAPPDTSDSHAYADLSSADGFRMAPPPLNIWHHVQRWAEEDAAEKKICHVVPHVPVPEPAGPLAAPPVSSTWRSIRALRALPDWDTPGGWRAVAQEEIDHVIKVKKALILRDHAAFAQARALYPNTHEVLNAVIVATQKRRANGDETHKKIRITVADVKGAPGSKFLGDVYSGAVDDTFVRFVANATLGRPNGRRRVLDVKGAYYEGVTVPASAGGRSLWIPVPAGWEDLGYPERTDGRRNFFEVVGNTPGLRDAGREFAKVYDAFLFAEGFVQSIVERRLFYRHLPTGLAVVCVYVDDNWTYFEDDAEAEAFYVRWSNRFNESKNVASAGSDFCGVSYEDGPGNTLLLSCEKLLLALGDMLAPFPANFACASPMNGDMLPRLRLKPTVENPALGPDKVAAARSILGLGMYIVRKARPDGLFAAQALAPYIVVNLTPVVWTALLQWAHYLVRTAARRLILRPPPQGALLQFCASSDSSSINVPLSASPSLDSPDLSDLPAASAGGFALFFEGSGAFNVECFGPRHLGDSSHASELAMGVWASKSILAFRMVLRELRLGPAGPTELEMDAKAVTEGVSMERVARRQRYQSARLAMFRQWIADGALCLKKTPSGDMRSDILSKPVAPVGQFLRLATLLLTGKYPPKD